MLGQYLLDEPLEPLMPPKTRVVPCLPDGLFFGVSSLLSLQPGLETFKASHYELFKFGAESGVALQTAWEC